MTAPSLNTAPPDRKAAPLRFATIAFATFIVALLLVGVSILAAFANSSRLEARRLQCRENLRQVGIAFQTYESKYGSTPVVGETTWFGLLVEEGLIETPQLRCPFQKPEDHELGYFGISRGGEFHIAVNKGSFTTFKNGVAFERPEPKMPMACDGNDGDTALHRLPPERLILFADGEVYAAKIGHEAERNALRMLHRVTLPIGTTLRQSR